MAGTLINGDVPAALYVLPYMYRSEAGDQDALLMPIVPVASSEDQVVVAYTESRGSRN
jgi:hypothetical protein